MPQTSTQPASPLARLERVLLFAEAQGGFISSAQLRQIGVPQQTVSRWNAEQLLCRFDRGIYRTRSTSYGFDDSLHLAALLANDQHLLGGRTALVLADLPGGKRIRPQLFGPQTGTRSARVTTHRVSDLKPYDRTTVAGFAVTTPLRSIIDSARWCNESIIGEQLTAGVERGLFTYHDATARVVALSRRGKTHLAAVRRVLSYRVDDPGLLSNRYEQGFMDLVERGGFPKPIPQHRVVVDGKVYFVDFGWPWLGKFAECDSMLSHSTPEQLQSDLERQNDLVSVGLQPIRFTFWDVFERPERTDRILAQHLPRTGEGW